MPILQPRVATPTPAQRRPESPPISDAMSVRDDTDYPDSSSDHGETEVTQVDPVGLSKLAPPKFYQNSKHRLLTELARAKDGAACMFHPTEFAIWAAYCRLCGHIFLCNFCTDHLKKKMCAQCPVCAKKVLAREPYRPMY